REQIFVVGDEGRSQCALIKHWQVNRRVEPDLAAEQTWSALMGPVDHRPGGCSTSTASACTSRHGVNSTVCSCVQVRISVVVKIESWLRGVDGLASQRFIGISNATVHTP